MDQMVQAVRAAFDRMEAADDVLFGAPVPESRTQRRLHEICLNHRLALHLGCALRVEPPIFVDIEFNKEGPRPKTPQGYPKGLRPDIVVHNRRSGAEKSNVLVVECKLVPAKAGALTRDTNKLKTLMRDPTYRYQYGLRVEYGRGTIAGTLYWHGARHVEEARV